MVTSGFRHFTAESISCFTADECTAVGGSSIISDGRWQDLEPTNVRPLVLKRPFECVVPKRHDMRCCRAARCGNRRPYSRLRMTPPGQLLLNQLSAALSSPFPADRPQTVLLSESRPCRRQPTSIRMDSPTGLPLRQSAQAQSLNAVSCIDSSCFAVGQNSDIRPYALGSTSNGHTWVSQKRSANAVDLQGLSCANARRLCCRRAKRGSLARVRSSSATTTGSVWDDQSLRRYREHQTPCRAKVRVDCMAAGVNSVSELGEPAGTRGNLESVPTQINGLERPRMPKRLKLHGRRIRPLRSRSHHRHNEWWRKLDCGARSIRDRNDGRCGVPKYDGVPSGEFVDLSVTEHRRHHEWWIQLVSRGHTGRHRGP